MTARFVAREVEIARIREAADEPPQLVIVRGRRRVGKSFLLNHALADRRVVFFQADEQPTRAQLELFAREVARAMPGNPPLTFADWNSALKTVGDQAHAEPLTVVLDEFQWLLQAEPHLDSIIQRHWDAWHRSRRPITLVLCGSAIGMMERLLDHGSPLFGRADYRPLITPLDYRRAAEFAKPGLSAEAKLMRYAVLGGTPQYQRWAGDADLVDVLAARLLAKDESLYEEPLHLLRGEQQIRDPGTYFAVVAAVAHGSTRLSQIANYTALIIPNLTKMLNRLVDLGYLELRAPTAPRQETKRSRYRVGDPYFRFWFRFIFPNRSRLARGRIREVLAEIERDLPQFMGEVFEDCCRDWLGRYAPTDQIPTSEQLGSWWSRNGQVEVDIVGTTRRAFALLGSCKWTTRASPADLSVLEASRTALGPAAASARLVIFARGFHDRLVELAQERKTELVALDELFQPVGP